ncbi:MAG: GNAT family N-acetyltransferase [Bacteroidales bacterium]|nr:GNAT family N-acetyltransferase [Bacteroidales bacterium]
MQLPVIDFMHFTLRPWHPDDAISLVKHANNPRVASNLRDGFPYPYTMPDAKRWLKTVGDNREDVILAIEVDGEASGGIGLHGLKDVYRYNGEIGYWLSERHWGRGIMSDAVAAMVNYAFTETSWLRLFACIYENNPSSMRVLEKNGFQPEAIHKKAVMKEGKLMDEHLYALLKDQWLASSSGRSSSSSADLSGSGPWSR